MSRFAKTIWLATCIACQLILIGGQLKTEWQLRNYYKCLDQPCEVVTVEDLSPPPEGLEEFDTSKVREMYATFRGVDLEALAKAFE